VEEIQRIELPIARVRQINVCGCGLAALEMVLRYYGADIDQVDFLRSDRRLQKRVERKDSGGLSESTIGTLALKRGFRVSLYGEKLRVNKTFLKLGGKTYNLRADKKLLLKLLQIGVPPIARVGSVKEAYDEDEEKIPHYVVVKGIDQDCSLKVADPWYDKAVSNQYWSDGVVV